MLKNNLIKCLIKKAKHSLNDEKNNFNRTEINIYIASLEKKLARRKQKRFDLDEFNRSTQSMEKIFYTPSQINVPQKNDIDALKNAFLYAIKLYINETATTQELKKQDRVFSKRRQKNIEDITQILLNAI